MLDVQRSSFSISGRQVGGGARCFVIAEAGVNHNGSLARALDLVEIAAASGADAVKFQTFDADRLVTRDAPKAAYQTLATGGAESQHAMLKKLELTADDHRELVALCRERGIVFLSTPFDETSADLLASFDIAAYKTPSGELTNLPFLSHVARIGKPMIVSTGMATLAEVEDAVLAIRASGCEELALLHCVSNYPAAPSSINLRAMGTLAQAFGVPVGYSDHSAGLDIAFASVALGATVIEKHFTQDRGLEGPDHQASLEPGELADLVAGIRRVEASLGNGRKLPSESELATAAVARKSLVASEDIAVGGRLTDALVVARRPGTGIPPKERRFVVGRSARVPIAAGTIIEPDMLD